MSFRAPPTSQMASTSGTESARHLPVRVFLLSSCSFLRDAIAHLLKKQADILLIGVQESSALSMAEIIASGCDVLLVDADEIGKLGGLCRDELRRSSPNLRIVLIEMEAGIADLLWAILYHA